MDSDNIENRRLKTPDMYRGMALAGIVVCHAVALVPGTGESTAGHTPWMEFIGCSIMMFFLISGYFYRPGSYIKNVKARAVQLALVMAILTVVLPLILYAEFVLLGKEAPVNELIESICLIFGGVNVFQPIALGTPYPIFATVLGYYFLCSMVWGFIFFYAVADWGLKSWKNTAVVVAVSLIATFIMLWIGYSLPYYLQVSPLAVAFMMIGAHMSKHKVFELLEFGYRSKKYWLILIPMAVAGILLQLYFGTYINYHHSQLGDYGPWSVFTFFLASLCCGYVVLAVCTMAGKIPYFSGLAMFIGRHSLAILLLHGFYIKLMVAPFYDFVRTAWFPAMPLFQTIVIAILALFESILTGILGENLVRYFMAKKHNAA